MRHLHLPNPRSLSLILLACMIASGAGSVSAFLPLPPGDSAAVSRPSFVAGEVVIGWQPEPRAVEGRDKSLLGIDRASPEWRSATADIETRTGLEVLDAQPEYGTARLVVPPGMEQAEIARLRALPWVQYAELNHIAHAAGYPSDPLIGNQWNMRRIGAPAAWDLTFGSYSLIVAVIDSGVDLGHPEFAGRLLEGYDYVNFDYSPDDEYGHGTHVTGIIAAAANNDIGVAGLAANVRILPLKVLNNAGVGDYAHIALAIRRAADYGAPIVNLSLGGVYDDQVLHDAVNYALSRGVFLAAAAGNCAQGGSQCEGRTNPDFYPAAYAGVFAVAATDHFDGWANYSGFKSYVALAAPGGISSDQIWSTVPGSGYGTDYGTSMATPLVSAAAALVLTYMPTGTGTQVADILRDTADKVGTYPYVGGRNDRYGTGRLNVARAVRWAYPPTLEVATGSQRFLLGAPITQARRVLSLSNDSEQPVTWQATVLEGSAWLSVTPSSDVATYSIPSELTLQVDSAAISTGEYDGVVEVKMLAPGSSKFQIYVTLKVVSSLQQQFLPLMVSQARWMDWIDPATGGQPIYPTDDLPQRVGLPFPVTFYGRTYYAISVSYKGYAAFTQAGSGTPVAQSTCLPTGALPNDAVYALWQDWDPALGGQVYTQQPDADRFALTWSQVRRSEGDLPHSFQIVFFRDGTLLLQYQAVQSPAMGTVGIESWDGTVAQQIACGGSGRLPISGDVFTLTPVLPW